MKELISKITKLKKDPVSKIISRRIEEFENITDEQLFSELCFCLMTANFKAEESIKIQKELDSDFHTENQEKLAIKLKLLGHRFWPQRAERIVLARSQKPYLVGLREMNPIHARSWLKENVKGLGMKEASHFLRNIGSKDIAIIDIHIIDLLNKEGLINHQKPSITPQEYEKYERILNKLAKKSNLTLAELDLYLWYLETGKVLK